MSPFTHPALRASAIALICACFSEPVQFDTLESDCRRSCHVVSFECENAGQDPQADEDRCAAYCVDLKEEALDQGDQCARSYEAMMVCVGAMVNTCEDWSDWAQRTAGGACTAEAEDFDRKCEL